jgi:hypothetical protein
MSIVVLAYALFVTWAVIALCALVLTDAGARRRARSLRVSEARRPRGAGSALALRLGQTQQR